MSVDPRPALVVLGTEQGGPAVGSGGEDLLAEADTVFAFPGEPESVALFYAEAWRVERISPRDGVARLTGWAAGGPAANGVLLVAGDPTADVALIAVLDGLARTAPDLDVRVVAGTRVAPPHRSPLIG
ncbi:MULTISPECIES: hypothetical protein [Pseudonocardia]|uniref:Uncharacterized protein n=2 Tax=Pseudonocardia TaxID=1847 RepID=A0A1Y2MRP9_PSEAH|nr:MULTISPECIES: hypothetical protein [Pseudonocardia]OSY37886.1 hypothetical protein BG845_04509 [Pseudonocardia autotrophica]TDN72451.1 hypothetical protein C8E95_1508 [Pseudonocardia autotrophica]BBG03160.1 hypothetical protein Pdca_43690 [Pseudonocardia autotrophica]GEC23776.1 hypothetical protein PSA01_08050 [Pseudonocardia saturnea]